MMSPSPNEVPPPNQAPQVMRRSSHHFTVVVVVAYYMTQIIIIIIIENDDDDDELTILRALHTQEPRVVSDHAFVKVLRSHPIEVRTH